MDWTSILLVAMFLMLSGVLGKVSSIEDKLDTLAKESVNIKNNQLIQDNILDEYLGKKVHLEIDNDDIENWYLFDASYETEGKILEYDNVWIAFQYFNKEKKRNVIQYFRRRDIKSINEVN